MSILRYDTNFKALIESCVHFKEVKKPYEMNRALEASYVVAGNMQIAFVTENGLIQVERILVKQPLFEAATVEFDGHPAVSCSAHFDFIIAEQD